MNNNINPTIQVYLFHVYSLKGENLPIVVQHIYNIYIYNNLLNVKMLI